MAPAAVLPVEPGDKVLDVCAAPGGKSTELAAKLQGKECLYPMTSVIPGQEHYLKPGTGRSRNILFK